MTNRESAIDPRELRAHLRLHVRQCELLQESISRYLQAWQAPPTNWVKEANQLLARVDALVPEARQLFHDLTALLNGRTQ